jgi:hypothetical protein
MYLLVPCLKEFSSTFEKKEKVKELSREIRNENRIKLISK